MSVRVSLASTNTVSSKFGIPASFDKLRRDQLSKGTLYEDPSFPASDASVFTKERPPRYPFQWSRPGEITPNPKLFVDSASRFDLKQGELGDCWVVASLAGMSEHPDMTARVIPEGQSFDSGWYAGMFVFRFWFFGKWTEVIIDDRLPVYNGRLMFIHSHQSDEFWGALVEKAYAKLIGSYEALRSGLIGDAMADLTSGLVESIQLEQKNKIPSGLDNILLKSFERQSLIGAGIKASTGGVKVLTGQIMKNGLVAGHAYTVTGIRKIRISDSRGSKLLTLIRIRNPWGSAIEWKGAWSDNSPEWNTISEQDRKAIGLVKADDGEFWIDWQDFLANFTSVDICHLPPTLSVFSAKRWKCSVHKGEWTRDKSAGGRPFCRDTHWRNPQFHVYLQDSEEDDNDTCTLLIALMQEDKRSKKSDNFSIGFAIYKASTKYKVPYPKEFFLYNRYVATSPFFVNARECVGRYELDEGSYIIVPSTYAPNVESRFLLRFFFEKAGSEVTVSDNTATTPSPTSANATAAQQNGPATMTRTGRVSSTDGPSAGAVAQNGVSQAPVRPETPLRAAFTEVAGSSGLIDAYQLIKILNRIEPTFQRWPQTAEVGKSLVSLADRDECFRLNFNEVEFLLHYVRAWLRVFNQVDSDSSGSIATQRLREVVLGMGYRLPDSLIRRFIHRFANVDNRIPLSGFISCLAFIVKVMNIYNECSDGKGKAELTLDDFFRAGLVI